MIQGKALIAGVAALVVIVVAVAAVALMGGSSDEPAPTPGNNPDNTPDVPSADIRYDYTASIVESFDLDYMTLTPDEGYVYLFIQYTFANDTEDRTLTTNPFYHAFTAELDRILYSVDAWDSSSLPGHTTREVLPGGVVSDCVVIQVPAGHDVSEFTIAYDYDGYPETTEAFDDSLM